MLAGGMPFSLSLPFSQCVVPDGLVGPVAIYVTNDTQPLANNARDKFLGNVVAGAPGVDLPLADAQHAALARATPLGLELLDVLLELVEVVHAVVGDADAADLALLDALDQAAPCLLACLGATIGGVQEHLQHRKSALRTPKKKRRQMMGTRPMCARSPVSKNVAS